MKRKTFYNLSLLLPYLVLAISLAIAYVTNAIESFLSTPGSLEVITGVLAFFSISGVIWGPLYTWMIIVMLIWGRGKSVDDIRRLYLLSPVLLACSMGIPAIVFSAPGSISFLLEGFLRLNNLGFAAWIFLQELPTTSSDEVPLVWFFMAAICLVIGYVFVGIVLWIERSMKKRGKFKNETEPTLETARV